MKKVIVFDLWQTLVGEPSTLDGYFPVLAKALSGQLNKETVGLAAEQLMMRRPINLQAGVKEICEYFGVFDKKVIKKITARWAFSCQNCFLFEDTEEILRELKKNYQIALITNTSRYGWQQVEQKFKLSRYFDLLVLSFERGATKPDQQLFEYVEQKLPAGEYWMIGDSFKDDFWPAQSLGWRTILIDRQKQGQIADFIFNKIKDK